MLYFLICFALAALPAAGASPEVTPVALFTHYQRPPAEPASQSIEREVESIMAPLGFPLAWRSLDAVRGNEVATSLAVVTFRGTCDAAYLPPVGRAVGALGITHVSDGVVIPFTDVDCDAIRVFLRRDLMGMEEAEREARFGRAVGRVLAHELFHVFAGTVHHGSGGVAKPIFTERELLSRQFRFEASEFRMLRVSLKAARQANQRLSPEASPASGEFLFRENGCARCHGKSGQGTRSGPALRLSDKAADVKLLVSKLTHNAARMCGRAKTSGGSGAPLDEDEIADVASFLNLPN